jgi:hypothetical protein
MPDENSLDEEKEPFVAAPYCISTSAKPIMTIVVTAMSATI